jgi:hypothetical protein
VTGTAAEAAGLIADVSAGGYTGIFAIMKSGRLAIGGEREIVRYALLSAHAGHASAECN